MLSRSVEVNNVRDLTQAANLHTLRLFMEDVYGPIESCVAIQQVRRNQRRNQRYFPPARIRFRSAYDAQKIFEGTALDQVKESALIACSLGCRDRRYITVSPSKPYSNMLTDDESLQGEIITIDATSLALGHWCPADEDMFLSTFDDGSVTRDEHEMWVEEVCLNQTCSLRIDLFERKMEINTVPQRSPHSVRRRQTHQATHSLTFCAFWQRTWTIPQGVLCLFASKRCGVTWSSAASMTMSVDCLSFLCSTPPPPETRK